MGAGAASGLTEKVQNASADELRTAVGELSDEQKAKLLEAVSAQAAAEASEPPVELPFVLDELFRCFDADQDGQIEREEFLACWEKLAEILDQSFAPKQRKEKVAWFKEAGAEGTPADGMYLSREKWQKVWLITASTESGVPVDQEPKLAAWMWSTYVKKLVGVFFPGAKPAVAAGDGCPSGPRPSYPMKIPLTEMSAKLEEAKEWNLRPLILGSGLSEIDTFFKYKIPANLTVEGGALFLMKKEEKKAILKRAMESEGLCAPILLKLGPGDTDVKKSCGPEFPADVFASGAWTPQEAFEQDFITAGMKDKLELDPKKWKDFLIITYSELGLDDGKAKLSEKIPHFDKMAVIAIDPDSVAKD